MKEEGKDVGILYIITGSLLAAIGFLIHDDIRLIPICIGGYIVGRGIGILSTN